MDPIWSLFLISGIVFLFLYLMALIISIIKFFIYKIRKKETEPIEWKFTLFTYIFETWGKNIKTAITVILIFISMVIAATWSLKDLIGTDIPGDFLEKQNYAALYYVNLYPDDSVTKNYRVYANLERKDGYYDIDKIYFNKRQYIIIDDVWDELKLNERTSIISSDGRWWDVELTNIKAEEIPE